MTAPPAVPGQWDGPPRWVIVPVLLGAALVVGVLVLAYRYGIPFVAAVVADQVPDGVAQAIGEQTLASLEGDAFEPTRLPLADRDRLVERFSRLRRPGPGAGTRLRILFRASPQVGPNAMALPSGAIVVTDALVALAESDDEVIAVLAHEAGHVERRHGLRLVLQHSFLGLAVAWLVGDPNALAAMAPTVLLQAKYSRDVEREADAYAVAVLDANGIPHRAFARMLERLAEASGGERGALAGYLSTHPVTADRLAALR